MFFAGFAQDNAKPVVVKFHEPKTDVTAEANVPIDPTVRVNLQMVGNMAFGLNADNVRLCFGAGSIQTLFKIDNVPTYPNTLQPTKLPDKTPKLLESDNNFLLMFTLSRGSNTDLVMTFPLQTG